MKRIFRFARTFADAWLHGRRYPPGRLNYFSSVHKRNRLFLLQQKARLGPIFKQWSGGNLTTVIVDHARARRFLSASEGNLPCATIDLKMLVPNGWIREMEGDLHRRYRRILIDALQAARWSAHEEAIRGIFRRRLERLAEARVGGIADTDVIRGELRAMAADMMLRLLFGMTEEHLLYEPLRRAYRRFGPDAPATRIKTEQAAAFAEIRSIVEQIADEVRSHRDRLPPCALKRLVETGAANDATALGHLIYTFETAHFDTYSLWRWILKHLSDNPAVADDMRKRLLADGPMRRRYAEAVVQESLRSEQAEALMRRVNADIEFDGFRIPKGGLARICLWEAHKDADVFDEPFRYNPMRFVERRYEADQFAPFGLDSHHCIGSALVLFSSALLVEELLAGYEWDVIADGEPHLGRFHWEPSPAFAIRLRPRRPAPGDSPTVTGSVETTLS